VNVRLSLLDALDVALGELRDDNVQRLDQREYEVVLVSLREIDSGSRCSARTFLICAPSVGTSILGRSGRTPASTLLGFLMDEGSAARETRSDVTLRPTLASGSEDIRATYPSSLHARGEALSQVSDPDCTTSQRGPRLAAVVHRGCQLSKMWPCAARLVLRPVRPVEP
jgi:hypothetical protein